MNTLSATLVRWTIEDYHRMIDASLFINRHVELLNGLVVEMSPEGPDHADLSTDALEFFMAAANNRYRIRAAKPITISANNSEPEPDIALVKPQSYRQSHPSPDDIFLIVEFSLTSLAKDTADKRRIYASAGIKDYWVVNLRDACGGSRSDHCQLIVYRNPSENDYTSKQQLQTGSISPLAFPDITLPVGALLD